jgi:hypothetical protein
MFTPMKGVCKIGLTKRMAPTTIVSIVVELDKSDPLFLLKKNKSCSEKDSIEDRQIKKKLVMGARRKNG